MTDRVAGAATEAGLVRYRDAESWPVEEALAAMLDSQSAALFAVRQALPVLAGAIGGGGRPGCAGARGRLVYAGRRRVRTAWRCRTGSSCIRPLAGRMTGWCAWWRAATRR